MIYLDTSILVAVLTNEYTATAIRQWYMQQDSQILATSDWSLTEFASAIALKERTQQLTAKQTKNVCKIFEAFLQGGIRLLEVNRQAFRRSATLIQVMPGLRAGDALHLAVALELGCKKFVTLDKKLAEKAAQAKLSVMEF